MKKFYVFLAALVFISLWALSYNYIKHTSYGGKVWLSGAISDVLVTGSIKIKFATDSTLNGIQLHVTTENGIVTLTGVAESDDLKEHAILLAKSTKGVKDVVSKIEVKPTLK